MHRICANYAFPTRKWNHTSKLVRFAPYVDLSTWPIHWRFNRLLHSMNWRKTAHNFCAISKIIHRSLPFCHWWQFSAHSFLHSFNCNRYNANKSQPEYWCTVRIACLHSFIFMLQLSISLDIIFECLSCIQFSHVRPRGFIIYLTFVHSVLRCWFSLSLSLLMLTIETLFFHGMKIINSKIIRLQATPYQIWS